MANGRESQSSAFFSAPGIEELYSGVTKNRRRRPDRLADSRDGLGSVLGVVVLVVGRDLAQSAVDLELRALGLEQVAGMAQKRGVVGVRRRLPLMPRTRIAYACFDSCSSVRIVTSLERAGSPLGRGCSS